MMKLITKFKQTWIVPDDRQVKTIDDIKYKGKSMLDIGPFDLNIYDLSESLIIGGNNLTWTT
jgi:hypothetical protein